MSLKYTQDHEWVDLANPAAVTVGITQHAQDALGDIVFVELPEVGRTLKQGEVAGVVESVKAAADVYMPLSGEIVAVNDALRDDPSLPNREPMKGGWLFRIKLAEPAQADALMDSTAYDALLKTL